ncbi:MAG: AMP-binding protein, partial [Bacteroidaceae bacterium]|nr:AMP-binding protein [Bacteroidaceae bacterium]
MIKDFNKVAIIAGASKISYTEMLQHISDFAQVCPKGKEAKTIILSENREGWIYAFFAIWANRGIAVPVDATSTVHDIAYIINDSKPDCIWTSRQKIDTAMEAVKEVGTDVKILVIDDYEKRDVASLDKATIEYEDEDTSLIIYTSGTTGNPKGVMLSFRNLFANICSVSDDVPIFNTERRTLILLPLHHVLPLLGSVMAPILRGGGVAIAPSLSAADIMSTLQEGKIGIIIGVPRLWQTLFGAMKKKIDSMFVTRFLFWLCQKVGNRSFSRMIFKSVRDKMGGHLDYCVCGGAPLDREISVGLKTLGLDVLEGYGMTETAPMISFTRPDDIVPGSVGKPLPTVDIKLLETGEICAKGPNVMKGYYNRPEETAAVLDSEGWIHTGDIGRFDDNGRLYITGRTKEIIVLSNGKNVNPSEIEYKLEKYDNIVKECAVTQDGDMLKAIIVP